MSGRRVDDHKAWMGSPSKGIPFPTGTHVKEGTFAEGDGALNHYEDTAEEIRASQEMADKKMKSHQMKPGYRQ